MGVFAAEVSDGRLGTPRRLSDPGTDGWLADLAGTPGGGSAVTGIGAPPGGPATLLASVRPAGGAFAATEAVADEPVADAPIRAAFDPVSARFTMIFRPSTDPSRGLLALATRSAP